MIAAFAGISHANDTGIAAIEVAGINPGSSLNKNMAYFKGKALRPFMDVLPSINTTGLPEAGKHERTLLIISRAYNIVVHCRDAEYDLTLNKWKEFDPTCAIAVNKNFEPGNPDNGNTFAWEPQSRLTTKLISGAEFVHHVTQFQTIEFYGKEAGKFLSILPPGGSLRITGSIAPGNPENRAEDISCGYGTYTRTDGAKENGVICKFVQSLLK